MTTYQNSIAPYLASGCFSGPSLEPTPVMPWRVVDQFASLESIVFAARSIGTSPVRAYGFRSSNIEVCQESATAGGWVLHWDENFFTYFQAFMFASLTFGDDAQAGTNENVATLLHLCAHVRAFRDPLFALAVLEYRRRLFPAEPPVRNRAPAEHMAYIYLVLRLVVYLHEQAHWDINHHPAAEEEAREAILNVVAAVENDGGPPGFGDAQRQELARWLPTIVQDPHVMQEAAIDHLAIRRVLQVAEKFDHQFPRLRPETRLALVYPAVMMWHYICASITNIKIHFTRNHAKDWQGYAQNNFLQPHGSHARNNVRGFFVVMEELSKIEERGLSLSTYQQESLVIKQTIHLPIYERHAGAFERMVLEPILKPLEQADRV